MDYVQTGKLKVDSKLYQFIQSEVLPGTGVIAEKFWTEFDQLIHDLAPKNKALLDKRNEMQRKIDEWHINHRANPQADEYQAYLYGIGYLEPQVEDFKITTKDIDDEIAHQAGPQLVVPVNNARYALNAANARWGSLYDALYGTDVIGDEDGAAILSHYNPARGEKVISYAKHFLDRATELSISSHQEAVRYLVINGQLHVELKSGETTGLKEPSKFIGYQGASQSPSAVLLKNHGIHIELQFDHSHPIGKDDLAGIKDIVLESALTTIMDCEDSVAAVDAEDKVHVYRNWLGLMKGDLSVTFRKGNTDVTRTLNSNRRYISRDGGEMTLPGRSLLFIRNVGHLMTNNAMLDQEGREVPEGILDAVVTSLIAKHDILKNGEFQNSSKGSIYIVKPKMHGSEEAAFSNELFNRVEDLLELKRNTLKIGVMDEERRTSLNLKACISQVKERIAFINTGFLDRTGDEIHTSMKAGPMIRKNHMKGSSWLQAYELSNVQTGLNCGLQGHAQIGKGMWAMPDKMKEMLEQKVVQLEAGCSTAWVPSPTAATLHALHYHQINVTTIQNQLKEFNQDFLDRLLEIPTVSERIWLAEEVQEELDNNVQGILGYVVRWVEQGIGCSKVPDINNVGLMEDRATLRISSQHIANWLHHGICTKDQVMQTLQRMAQVVDEQNAGDSAYRPMAGNFESSFAFIAACELIFNGIEQPNGYTEPILHRCRKAYKTWLAAHGRTN